MAQKLTMPAQRGAIVNAPAVDWLDCSTFDLDQWELVKGMIQANNVSRETFTHTQFKNYSVERLEWASWSEGSQVPKGEKEKRVPHYLIHVGGKESDAIMREMLSNPAIKRDKWNFSRIDLQYTVPKMREKSLALLGIELRDGLLGDYESRGKPKSRAWVGHENDTLYIGSPSSAKQLRFYDKPVLIGRNRETWERYELQLRDKLANGVVSRLWKQAPQYARNVIAQSLKSEYRKLPIMLQEALSHRDSFDNVVAVPLKPEISDKAESARLKWFKSLKRSIIALACAKGIEGQQAREILLEALVVACTGDNTANWMDYVLVGTEANIIEPLEIVAENE